LPQLKPAPLAQSAIWIRLNMVRCTRASLLSEYTVSFFRDCELFKTGCFEELAFCSKAVTAE
jgi:hypothetical protein